MISVSNTYLELFLENLRNLPFDLHNQFSKISDLDKKMINTVDSIQKYQREYLTINNSKRPDKSKQIRDQIKLGKSNSDEKFRIINEIYDSVDNCIRRLDSDFSRFESELKGGKEDLNAKESLIKIKAPKVMPKKKMNNRRKVNEGKAAIKKSPLLLSKPSHNLKILKSPKYAKKIKYSSENHAGIPASASLVLTLTNNPNEVLEMPTDPYEPVYCDCHDVSYGDMIGCDNIDCPIEWFHFACVGITDKPKGLWYCPRCRPKFSKF